MKAVCRWPSHKMYSPNFQAHEPRVLESMQLQAPAAPPVQVNVQVHAPVQGNVQTDALLGGQVQHAQGGQRQGQRQRKRKKLRQTVNLVSDEEDEVEVNNIG
jgi:hypothetical protein